MREALRVKGRWENAHANEKVLMAWYVCIAWFFAGAFLANAIPHTVQGICGNRFQTPFASPPGVGESSAVVNVIWGLANLKRCFLPRVPCPRQIEQPAKPPAADPHRLAFVEPQSLQSRKNAGQRHIR